MAQCPSNALDKQPAASVMAMQALFEETRVGSLASHVVDEQAALRAQVGASPVEMSQLLAAWPRWDVERQDAVRVVR